MNAREIARRIRPARVGDAELRGCSRVHSIFDRERRAPERHRPGPSRFSRRHFAVIAVRLVMRFREAPWPPGLEDRRRMHGIILVIFMLAGLVPALRLPSLGSAHGWLIAPLLASAGMVPIASSVHRAPAVRVGRVRAALEASWSSASFIFFRDARHRVRRASLLVSARRSRWSRLMR